MKFLELLLDILKSHSDFIQLIIYLILFLPVIALNISAWIATLPLPTILIILILVPGKTARQIDWDFLEKFKAIVPGTWFYSTVLKIQEDLTDNFPNLPRKTIIMPFQNWIYNQYKGLYSKIFGAFLQGMSQAHNDSNNIEPYIPKNRIDAIRFEVTFRIQAVFILEVYLILMIVLTLPAFWTLYLVLSVIHRYLLL